MIHKIKMVIMYLLVCVLAPLSIGYVTGYMTGYSRLDKTVLTALLPGVISLVGLVAFAGIGTGMALEARALTSSCLVILCVGLMVGLQLGQEIKEKEDKNKRAQRGIQQLIDLEYKKRLLMECADREHQVNKRREKWGLGPIDPDKLCP